jgi:DNA-binding response OmpR family regulator
MTDLTTPTAPPGIPSPHAEAARPARRAPAARVLIADDEPRIRLALRRCLESEGYEVDEAADGMEALDAIIRRAPDVMVLDIAMPNLDGMRALQELEPLHGLLKPRVVVLTAWGSLPAAMRAIGLGASAFIEKPLSPAALLRAVRDALEEGGPDAAGGAERDGVRVDWDEPLRQ